MTTYQILSKIRKFRSSDWRDLESQIRPFAPSFSLTIILKNQTFFFYLTTPQDITPLLSNQHNLFFKKAVLPSCRPSRLRPMFTLPDNLFSFIADRQLKKAQAFSCLTIRRLHFPFPLYLTLITFTSFDKQRQSYLHLSSRPPYHLLALNFTQHHTFHVKTLPKFTNPRKIKSLLAPSSQRAIAKVDLFPHYLNPLYLPVRSVDWTKHSLVIGQTGTGKSKLIQLILGRLNQQNELPVRIILIDPHVNLAASLQRLFPQRSTFIDFFHNSVALFAPTANPNTATELTFLLFKTLLGDQFNSFLARLLRYTLFALYATNNASLIKIKKLLTDEGFKNRIIQSLPSSYVTLKHFFDTDFIKYQTAYYETTFIPLISLLEELDFLPQLARPERSLAQTIGQQPLTIFSLNRLQLGNTNTKLISGLLIQQIFLLAQAHIFQEPIVLAIDEAPLIENAAFTTILSQSRKFHLSLLLSYQYLSQTDPALLESLKANVYNYFVFKTSSDDAALLTHFIDLKISPQLQEDSPRDFSKTQIFTDLNPRQFIARLFHKNRFYPAFKARTIDVSGLASSL